MISHLSVRPPLISDPLPASSAAGRSAPAAIVLPSIAGAGRRSAPASSGSRMGPATRGEGAHGGGTRWGGCAARGHVPSERYGFDPREKKSSTAPGGRGLQA